MGNFFKNRGRVLALFGVVGFVALAGVGAYYATQRTTQAQTATTESGCKITLASMHNSVDSETGSFVHISTLPGDQIQDQASSAILASLKNVGDSYSVESINFNKNLYAVGHAKADLYTPSKVIYTQPFQCAAGRSFAVTADLTDGVIWVDQKDGTTGTSDTSSGRTTGTSDEGVSGTTTSQICVKHKTKDLYALYTLDASGYWVRSNSTKTDFPVKFKDSEKGNYQTVYLASCEEDKTAAAQPAIGTDEVGATGLEGFVIPGAGGSSNTAFWGKNTLTLRAVRYTREGGEDGTNYVPVGGVRYEIEVIKPSQGVETSGDAISQQQPSLFQRGWNYVNDAFSSLFGRAEPSQSHPETAHAQSLGSQYCCQVGDSSPYRSDTKCGLTSSNEKEVDSSKCTAASSASGGDAEGSFDDDRSASSASGGDAEGNFDIDQPDPPKNPTDWKSNVWSASQVNWGGLRRAVNGETANISGVIPDNGLSSRVRIGNLPNGYYRVTVSKNNFKTAEQDFALTSYGAVDLPIAPSPGAEAPANGFAGVPTQYPSVSNKSILYVGGLEPEALVYDSQVPWYGWQRASSYITTRPTYDLTPGIPDYVPPLNVETMSGWNMGGIFGGIGSCDYLLSTFGSGADPVAAGLSAFLLRFKGEKHNNLGEGLLQGLGAYAIAKLFNSDGQTINIDQLYNYCIARNTNVLNNMPSACWPCLVSQSTQTCPYECRMYVTQYAPSYMQ